MFGIFNKNKEKDFKLDQDELKPLSDFNSSDNISNNSPMGNNFSGDNLSPAGLPVSNNDLGMQQGLASQNPSNMGNNSFIDPSFNQNQNNPSFGNNSFNASVNNNSDLLNTQIENLQASQNLLKTKVETIEHKLDLILKILENEVSEQTKEKLNLDSMRNTLNSRLQNNNF